MKILALSLGLSLMALCANAQAPAASPKPPAPKPAGAAAQAHPATKHSMNTTSTDPQLLHPANLKAKAPETFEATFVTTKGDFVVQVTRAWSPLGADRFYNLVKHGFYNGNPFFRIVPGFVVQFGLTGNPAVNKAWQDAGIQDEPVKEHNLPGYVTYAKSSMPNSRTTQLFINLGDNSSLDAQGFAPFGKVISGMDVVQKLYPGYGQDPDQGAITSQGSGYFSKKYPNLDLIKTATITSPASSGSAAAHPAASGAKKPQ
jgi:peptidyl-prolyl cis-trans isomerase A (cyclophilin A)